MKQEFSFKLDLLSLISISTLLSFCSTLFILPFYLLKSIAEIGFHPGLIFTALIASPILAILGGALAGLLAYPLYTWITDRVGFKYKGKLWLRAHSDSTET